MNEIPMEWVDKLFNCMAEFYGERWTRYFDKPHLESFYKTMWKNGLVGLDYNQIKNALVLCKRSALDARNKPPHVMEFFRIAKGFEQPPIDYHPNANKPTCNPEVQKQAMEEIRQKLGKMAGLEIYGRLAKG